MRREYALFCLHMQSWWFDTNAHLQLLSINRKNNNGSELIINIIATVTTPKKSENTVFTFLPNTPWLLTLIGQYLFDGRTNE